jgi:hypothetical protein
LSKLVRRAGLIVGRIERYAGQQKITLGKCDDAAALVRLMVCGAADAMCKLTRVLFILGQTLPTLEPRALPTSATLRAMLQTLA